MRSADALRPVLVIALDGATFDVIEPMAAAGELPNLARWMKEGRAGGLPSTVPGSREDANTSARDCAPSAY